MKRSLQNAVEVGDKRLDTTEVAAYLNQPEIPGSYYPTFSIKRGLVYYFTDPNAAFAFKMRFL
ncbi:MAG: hypothetical protein EOP83_10000 [Verrucomicrobiaceae bacterium]|nr:MAG: hypothetical protein EOP83_10000 [Verrucomicrobiaceae bacterium]